MTVCEGCWSAAYTRGSRPHKVVRNAAPATRMVEDDGNVMDVRGQSLRAVLGDRDALVVLLCLLLGFV